MNNEPDTQKKSPALALILGFMPAALLLGATAVTLGLKLPQRQSIVLFALASVAGVTCSFTASIMLFRRKTGLAIFGGIFFLLCSLGIALFMGCIALLSGMKF